MGQYRQITRTVTLTATGGAADTLRCWDAPTGCPLRQLTIIISSNQLVLPANNLDWDVIYGGKWAGDPFATTSTHSGGLSQGSGSIAGSTEVLSSVYNTTSLIPMNNPNSPSYSGFPIVVELENKKASAITVYVTFISETLNTNV
jgi:hypothetical protein